MKRKTSLTLSLAIMLNTAAGLSVPAAAESENTKEYVHSGYTVTYDVVSEWTENQNINVTIENTGEEEICGWAVKYEPSGEISGLWNGTLYDENENGCIISSQDFNGIICPNDSVTFGYTLSGEGLEFPEEMLLCNEWKEAEESVEVSYEIIDDWGSTYQAQIFIANNTEKEINCWKLGFDFTGEIDRIWNGVLLTQNRSGAVVRGNETTNGIAPGKSTSFSFIGRKNKDEIPELSDFVLYESCINAEKKTEDIALQLMGYADFSDDKLTINWYSTVEEGKFQVLKSQNNESYEVIAELEDVLSYEYGAVDFEKAYFVVTQLASDSRYTESAVIAVKFEDGELDWEYLDTDEDGIPDVYEESIGTDINKADTDEDGLSDYEELYLTNTDPLVYNSVNEELSDADADCDEDGISNKSEIENGTNPLLPDTDYDSINDGKEAEFGTDPVNSDTDGDGIGDGDELILNLDPKSDTTDGVKDSERTTVQEITADSEIMSEINGEENPMKVSIELEAAGLAENSLNISESGYSSAMSNSAIIGGIPEFSYPEGLATGEVTVKFKVDESVKENTVGEYAENCEELKGIKRFNVFKYFEDTNMLLPIETFHDEEEGIVYTKTDCLGTYCVMDLEIWMQNLGIEAEETNSENGLTEEEFEVEYLSGGESTGEKSDDEKLNVVFLLDARPSLSDEEFDSIKELLYNSVKDILSGYISGVDISVMVSRGYNVTEKLNIRNFEDAEKILNITNKKDSISNSFQLSVTSFFEVLYSIYKDKAKETLFIMMISEESVVAETAISEKVYRKFSEQEKIHLSLVSDTRNPDISSYVVDLINATEGKIIKSKTTAIRNYVGEYLSDSYSILLANNHEYVKLDDMLKKDSGTDTDKDDLTDWEEVCIDLIYDIADSVRGKTSLTMYDMPTMNQYIERFKEEFSFIQDIVDLFNDEDVKNWSDDIGNIRMTPVISNPADIDSDGDEAVDNIDIYPLVYDETPNEFRKMYFANLISAESIHHTDDGFYISMVSVKTILEKMNCDLKDETGIKEREYFDDWYLYAIKSDKDYIYSMLKLREIGDLDPKGRVSTCGVSVPFCSIDMGMFNDYTHVDKDSVDVLFDLANGKIYLYNEYLALYFANTKSVGSYLIGELYIEKVLSESFANKNFVKITNSIDVLEISLNLIGPGIYTYLKDFAFPPESITIKDVHNITHCERYQILRYSLGSSSLNSFAAEVQAHAIFACGRGIELLSVKDIDISIAYNPYVPTFIKSVAIISKLLPYYIEREILKHSAVADVAYGEEALSVITLYLYLEDWSLITQWQILEHGYILEWSKQ